MRSYILFVLPLLLAVTLIPSSLAQPYCLADFAPGLPNRFYCQAWTDKPFYSPADTGKLTIDLKNINSFTVKVNYLTINFPWVAYINGQWDGNSTIQLNANVTSNQWMPEQTISFTVPNDGRFTSGLGAASGSVEVRYTSYCSSCDSGRDGSVNIRFSIAPNSFLFSTGWQTMSNYLLYTDILLGALVVLFLVYILQSRQKGPAMPRVTPSG